MNRITKFLQIANKVRNESLMGIKVGAVVVKGSRAIKAACNATGKPKFIGSWSRHAEVRATLNINVKDADVYVYREHGIEKSPLLAKPCNHCIEWLQFVGVKRVVYSISEYPYFEEMSL